MNFLNNQSSLYYIIKVFFSNFFKFISSLIIIFLLPNILGVENYGFYKVYLLYLSYLGIFHFGFIDGIYLKYGGIKLENLDKVKFRTYFFFFIVFQLILFLFFTILVGLFLSGHRLIIFLFVLFNLIPINVTTYFQFISQITFRFNEYSQRLYVLSILNLISVLFLYMLNLTNYIYILIFSTLANIFLLTLYLYTYRDLIFGEKIKFKKFVREILELFTLGMPLLLSNLSTIMLLSIDKLFVEFFFDISSFSIYSFSYSILVLINLVVSSISTVLYPVFKKINISVLSKSYSNLNLLLNAIVFLGLFIYFPIRFLLPIFLPNYIESLSIIRIALPSLIFTSTISSLTHNLYKVHNNNKQFFWIGVIAIVSLLIFLFISYFYNPSIINLAYTTLIGMAFWYFLLHEYIKKKYSILYFRNFIISILVVLIYLFLSDVENLILSGSLYLGFYLVFFLHEFTNLKQTLHSLIH